MKICTDCKLPKKLSKFSKDRSGSDGLQHVCKSCNKIRVKEYHHTKDGLISRIYNSQIQSSKKRNQPAPTYSKLELKDWLFSQKIFHELFDNWRASGFDKMTIPSCDRDDDYLGYRLARIELKTWKENSDRGSSDRKNGINNKHSKSVLQFTKGNVFIKEFYSTAQASRELNISQTGISKVCRGKYKSAGGYIWQYKGLDDK